MHPTVLAKIINGYQYRGIEVVLVQEDAHFPVFLSSFCKISDTGEFDNNCFDKRVLVTVPNVVRENRKTFFLQSHLCDMRTNIPS